MFCFVNVNDVYVALVREIIKLYKPSGIDMGTLAEKCNLSVSGSRLLIC